MKDILQGVLNQPGHELEVQFVQEEEDVPAIDDLLHQLNNPVRAARDDQIRQILRNVEIQAELNRAQRVRGRGERALPRAPDRMAFFKPRGTN
jgi:hypothetical protein